MGGKGTKAEAARSEAPSLGPGTAPGSADQVQPVRRDPSELQVSGKVEAEGTGYLQIQPGMRIVIEYDDPLDTILFGGPGTVVRVVNAWTARIIRDADGVERTYCRWLLSSAGDGGGEG